MRNTPATTSLPSKPKTCPVKVPGSRTPEHPSGIGILSYNSKMPCPSFSLPAVDACPGMVVEIKDRPTDPMICAGCNAQKGKNALPRNVVSKMIRFEWTQDCIRRGESGMQEWVSIMAPLIRQECARMETSYFRWDDSGDVFSVGYARLILLTIRATPDIMHWLPTRSYRIPAIDMVLRTVAAEPNITVRPSALGFNDPAPVIDGYAAGSAVSTGDSFTCPAHLQGNVCGAHCRTCWDSPTVPVTYHASKAPAPGRMRWQDAHHGHIATMPLVLRPAVPAVA